MPNSISLEPRISVLEKGQENLQADLLSLSGMIKEQGTQLTNSISNLANAHNQSYNNLNDKLNNIGKTDWTTFWTMIGTLIIILGGISTPVWINFAFLDRNISKIESRLEKMESFAMESIKDRSELRARVQSNEK